VAQATERIIDQIRNIRNLADNAGTEGEAAAAAAMMQRLLQKYNLDLSMIPEGQPDDLRDEPVSDETIKVQTKQNDWRWRMELLQAIATYNFCRTLQTSVFDKEATEKARAAGKKNSWRSVYREGTIVIGQPHNREVVRFLYDLLTQTLERLGKAYSTRSTDDGEDIGDGRKAYRFSERRAFYYGAVEVLRTRLANEWQSFQKITTVKSEYDSSLGTVVEKKLTVSNDKALALIKGGNEKVAAFVKVKYPVLGRGRSYGKEASGAHPTNSMSAYQAGRQAGQSIPLQRGLGTSGAQSGTKALGEGKR
jgi:hypothetical protein